MITKLLLKNFKAIRNAEIQFGRLTVLVGANGSGKASVLHSLDLALRAAEAKRSNHNVAGKLRESFSGERHPESLHTRGAKEPVQIRIDAESAWFAIQLRSQGGDHTTAGNGAFPELKWSLLQLQPRQIASPSYSKSLATSMSPEGSGLTSVLAHLALNDPDAFAELNDCLRRFIPRFSRLRFHPQPVEQRETEIVKFGEQSIERLLVREETGHAMLFDFEGATGVEAHAVSEGTLILLGILTAIRGTPTPDLLLLDNLEHGLHPLAQEELVVVLRELLSRFPSLQIVATAHSPYLLDHLNYDEVRLMALDDDGFSVCGTLERHPQFAKWKEEMAPGELWSLFGEKWLTQQPSRP